MKKTILVFALAFCTVIVADAQAKTNDFEIGKGLTIKNERISFNFFGKKEEAVVVTNSNPVEEQEVTDVSLQEENNEIQKPQINIPNISVKRGTNNRGHVVYIGNKQAAWFVKDLGEFTTEKRANVYANNIKNYLAKNGNPNDIKPYRNGSQTFIRANGTNLITVDELNARAIGVSAHELSYSWANNTRIALGVSPLKKDYAALSRGMSGNNSRYFGQTTVGIASWYGGEFHGRRSSDGSRFNKEEFTAAHRTYPFGTLVKVTNLKNNKSCVVKVTDRGPYAGNRVMDVSKQTAQELGMLSSGLAKVKLEVVGHY